jgi:hypothetical protein
LLAVPQGSERFFFEKKNQKTFVHLVRSGRVGLILTAVLDARSQGWFEALRRAHFPPELNHVPAHLTLFHHLPGEQFGAIAPMVATVCAATAAMPVAVLAPRFLGRGVAFDLHAPALAALRELLRREWHDWLTAQDRQAWRPHITVQNKVPAAEARALQAKLAAVVVPAAATAAGLHLWRYLGGPWESAAEYTFIS